MFGAFAGFTGTWQEVHSIMAKPKVKVLGAQQLVEEYDSSSYTLHDPFVASTLEYVRRCLDQLSKALHVTIVCAYKQLPLNKRKSFFLASFNPWKLVKKGLKKRNNFGDPSKNDSGHDIQWLLKNLRFNIPFYAEKLDMEEDDFDDLSGFLLDSIRNQLAHQYYLKPFDENDPGNPWLRKHFITKDCIDASVELVAAIYDSEYFASVQSDVEKIKNNLERMRTVLEEHKLYKDRKKVAEGKPLDTDMVLKFLTSDALVQQLEAEKKLENGSPIEQPLTHFFQMIVIPRIMNEDSNYMEIN